MTANFNPKVVHLAVRAGSVKDNVSSIRSCVPTIVSLVFQNAEMDAKFFAKQKTNQKSFRPNWHEALVSVKISRFCTTLMQHLIYLMSMRNTWQICSRLLTLKLICHVPKLASKVFTIIYITKDHDKN